MPDSAVLSAESWTVNTCLVSSFYCVAQLENQQKIHKIGFVPI